MQGNCCGASIVPFASAAKSAGFFRFPSTSRLSAFPPSYRATSLPHLELYGHMPNPQIPHRLPDSTQDVGVIGELRYHGVPAHGYHPAGHRPHVQVVDCGDAGDRQHPPLDFCHGDVSRNGLEEDVGALSDQARAPPGSGPR